MEVKSLISNADPMMMSSRSERVRTTFLFKPSIIHGICHPRHSDRVVPSFKKFAVFIHMASDIPSKEFILSLDRKRPNR